MSRITDLVSIHASRSSTGSIYGTRDKPVERTPAGWISETAALAILTGKGEFSEAQALIVLGHSLQRLCNGLTHYPRAYIEQRATDHANKPEPNAWDCR